MKNLEPIVVSIETKAILTKVWEYWNAPKHITQWYFASEDWHAPSAENDLTEGGSFKTRMEAKDGSFGFDLEGIYSKIIPGELINYELPDGRKVSISFAENEGICTVQETFDPETENSIEMQKNGWQAILNNFKKYVEAA
jgi:uncharacterized protein YndB with AHSA1/START domain